MKRYAVIIPFVFIFPMSMIAGESEGEKQSGVAARALELFREGRLDEAQKVVDAHYQETDAYISLLSGMIYAEKGECRKAKESTAYVEGYYDKNYWKMSEEEKLEVKDIYTNIKRVSIKCNDDLGLWAEQVSDLKIYRRVAEESEQYEVSALLADAYRVLAKRSIKSSIDEYERVLSLSDEEKGLGEIAEESLFRLQELYLYTGDFRKAEEYAKRLLEKTSRKEEWVKQMKESSIHRMLLERGTLKPFLEP